MNFKEYILTCIGEEGGEVTQASSKCLRFGMVDFHPDNGMQPNGTKLIMEVNDLIAMVELLGETGFIDTKELNSFEAKMAKKEKFYKYLKYAEKCGCVQLEVKTVQPEPFVLEVGQFMCKGDKSLNSNCGFCDKCKFYGWSK